MKICFLIGSMDSGGAERVISILANKFSENNNIHIITWSNNDSFYKLNANIVHHKLNLKYDKVTHSNHFIFNIIRCSTLTKKVKEINPDILISFITSNNVMGIIASKVCKIPIMISERGELYSSDISHFWRILRKLIYRYADILVLQTLEAKNIVFKYKLWAKNNIVIPNPIEINNDVSVKDDVILFVGRLSTEKRVKDLIVAFSSIVKNQFNYNLWIVGEGVEKDNLLQLTKDLNLEKHVVFFGNQKSVEYYYRRSKIFVLPSISEGFPNVLLEAMNYNNIVVSSNCPTGPSEIIDDKIDGFLYDPKNVQQLQEILLNVIDNYSQLVHFNLLTAKKIRERFSVESVAESWLKCINLIAKDNKQTDFD